MFFARIFRNITAKTADRRALIQQGGVVQALLFLSSPTILMTVVSSMIILSDGLFLNNTSSTAVAGAIGYAAAIINTRSGARHGILFPFIVYIGALIGSNSLYPEQDGKCGSGRPAF